MLNLSLTYVCILTFFQIPFYKQRLLWYHIMVNLSVFSEEWVQAHSLILCADAHAARHTETKANHLEVDVWQSSRLRMP